MVSVCTMRRVPRAVGSAPWTGREGTWFRLCDGSRQTQSIAWQAKPTIVIGKPRDVCQRGKIGVADWLGKFTRMLRA